MDDEALSVRELVERGDRRLSTGDAQGALADYERAVAADDDDGEAIAGVALALAELCRRQEGLARLLAAASAEHGPACLVWVARALVVLGDVEEARAMAGRLTEAYAGREGVDRRLAADLAQLWLDVREPERGLEMLPPPGREAWPGKDGPTAAPEEDGGLEAQIHATRGNCLAALERREEALVDLAAAVELAPQDPQALLDSAAVLALLGRSEEAHALARRARATAGLDPWGRLALVDVLDHVGAVDEARELLVAMVRDEVWRGQRVSAVALAEKLAHHGEAGRAVDLLDALLSDAAWASCEDALPALRLRAQVFAAAGEHARAAEDLDALAARGAPFDDPELRSLAASTYVAAGRHAQALPHLRALVESAQGDERIAALLLTGMALVALGHAEDARVTLREAYEESKRTTTDPQVAALVALFLAIALGGEDRPQQHRLLAEADGLLAPDDPHRPQLRLKALELAVLDEEWEEALGLSEGLAEQLPPPARSSALFLRGRTLVQRSQPAAGRALLDAALAPEERAPLPLRVNILTWRAVALGVLGEHARARADLQEALDLVENASTAGVVTAEGSAAQRRELRLLAARAASRAGDPAAALDALDDLAARDPAVAENAVYWELRGEALVALDRLAEGAEAAGRLARLDPTKRRFALFLQLGLVALQLDWSGFAEMTEELTTTPPEPAGALDWLLTAYVRAWVDHPGAPEAFERAVALDPALRASPLGQQVRLLVAAQTGDAAAFHEVPPPTADLGPRAAVLWHLLRAKALLVGRGREREALEEFGDVVRLAEEHPDDVTAQQAVVSLARAAQVRLDAGEVAAAGADLEQAERFLARLPEPGALLPIVALVRALWQLARSGPDDALAELARADDRLLRLPRDQQAVVAYLRGSLLRLRGDDEKALHALRQAIALAPHDPSLLRALAAVQVDLGDDDAALETIGRALAALQSAPARAGGAGGGAAGGPETGEPEQRRRELRRLESVALRRSGRLEAALESARQALADDWGDPHSWLTLAEVYEALDRLDQAVRAYRRGWALSRDDDGVAARCLVGLGHALLAVGKDREALTTLDGTAEQARIDRLGQTYGAVPYNRAVALLRTGQEEPALRALGEAARAHQPVPQASALAAAVAERRRRREGSWVGYWFRDPAGGRWRPVVGGALLLVFALGTVIGMANPAQVTWLRWASTDSAGRLVLLLVAAALLLLPVVTRLKVGAVEIEQPQPVPADAPDLEPVSVGDVMADVRVVVARTTAAPMTPAGAVPTAPSAAGGMVPPGLGGMVPPGPGGMVPVGTPTSSTADLALAVGATAAPQPDRAPSG